MHLWKKVTLGMILGIIAGLCLPKGIAEHFCPIGTIFLSLLKMVIGPLIFCSLVNGITSVTDPKLLGRLGLKSLIAFILTTLFAVLFSIVVGNIFKPGVGSTIQLGKAESIQSTKFNVVDFIVKIFPDNALSPFTTNNTIQIVFLAMFIGIMINKIDRNESIKNFFSTCTALIFKMIEAIIQLSPYAAFALISFVVSTQGIDILLGLSKLIGVVTIAMVAQYFIFGLMILVFCRMSPIPFYKKSFEYQLLAFSTSSSRATLPITMEICKHNLGISDISTSFVLPLGAAINMCGMAINLGLTTIFFAQVVGVHLSYEDYLMLIFMATIGSIGGAGVPSGSLIMLPMVLSSVGIPIEGVAILAGIDRILDMMRTTINITGDVAVTLIVDHNEKMLNKEIYDKNL